MSIFRISLFLGLSICFLFQANLQFQKFLHGNTTLAIRTTKRNQLKYPVITLCPTYPFKTDVVKLAGFDPNFWTSLPPENWNPNMTILDWNDFLDNSTYRIDELVSSIRLHNGSVINKLELQDNELITIKKIPTDHRGVCYSISINLLTFLPTDYVALYFKHPSKENDINIFYHKAVEETYLMALNYWIMQPTTQISKSGYTYSNEFVVKCHLKKPDLGHCNETATTASQHGCIAQEIATNCHPCSFPLYSILQDVQKELMQNTTLCSSETEFSKPKGCFVGAIIESRNSRCLRPCISETIELYSRKTRNLGDVANESIVVFYFRSLEVEESEEYVLVDIVTALSGIGGSMGMFLGFSFYNLGLNIIQWINSKLENS